MILRFPYAQSLLSLSLQTLYRQVQPAFAMVEYDGICRDDMLPVIEHPVNILHDLNVQIEGIRFPNISDQRFQPTGIGNRLIQKDTSPPNLRFLQDVKEKLNGIVRLRDDPVCAA